MQTIPLSPQPNQTFTVQLGTQTCVLNVYQKFYGLFCDLYVNGVLIVQGVLCLNANYIVRSLYLGFQGDLVFWDTQPDPILGPSDPSYPGLGTRFVFYWLQPTDLPATYGLSS